MSKDITQILGGWDFQPGKISVRIVPGEDGRDKIQLRLDLGLLQMEFDGRPDGQRVSKDSESWLEYYQRRQQVHDKRYPDGPPFTLDSEDCSRLLREGVQYYHRYISFWRLERYELCARDTSRNLKLFAYVREYAADAKDKLLFDQYRPYVTMMHARAVATPLISLSDYDAALQVIEAAIAGIRQFLVDYDQEQNAESCVELNQLLEWRTQLEGKRPTKLNLEPENRLARLRADLETAIRDERFEEAARLRDLIRQHIEDPMSPGSPELM